MMKTVLFYSFKGGVGRTQTLFNVAKCLAEKGKRLLIVDFDLYAPGLSYLANSTEGNNYYFLEFLIDIFKGSKKEQDIYKQEIVDNLYLIPAFDMRDLMPYNKLLTELSKYLYSIKSESDKRVDQNTTVADDILDIIVYNLNTLDYDYIFFDARTGITEVSDILFSYRVDLKVIISSYNQQNIDGTNAILQILSRQKIYNHKILRLLSPKPEKKRQEFKKCKARANLDDNPDLKEKLDWVDLMEIPYENELVVNDVNVWERLDNKNSYKLAINDIAQTIEASLEDEF